MELVAPAPPALPMVELEEEAEVLGPVRREIQRRRKGRLPPLPPLPPPPMLPLPMLLPEVVGLKTAPSQTEATTGNV